MITIPVHVESEEDLPVYATAAASGADVRAKLKEPLILQPGKSAVIPTGLRFDIPAGYEIQVRPRSGLAAKFSVTVLNSPGTVDADFRGEVGVILINHGTQPFTVEPGMRIAQLVVASVIQVKFVNAEGQVLSETLRGSGGFGHTGLR